MEKDRPDLRVIEGGGEGEENSFAPKNKPDLRLVGTNHPAKGHESIEETLDRLDEEGMIDSDNVPVVEKKPDLRAVPEPPITSEDVPKSS